MPPHLELPLLWPACRRIRPAALIRPVVPGAKAPCLMIDAGGSHQPALSPALCAIQAPATAEKYGTDCALRMNIHNVPST